jgi:hypothetical protein
MSQDAEDKCSSGSHGPSDRALILETSDLLAGDVLLYRPRRNSVAQQKISAATNSPYTHVAIYIGDNLIAESVAWPCLIGVRKSTIESSMKRSQCVGVLRSQVGFGHDRPGKLTAFVESVIRHRKFYNLIAASKFERDSEEYFGNQLAFIRDNYGSINSHEAFARQSFFCSAFVVACYSVVEIIGQSAQVAFPPKFFSPAGLYRDPTFGWLLGYLLPKDGSIPDNDPLSSETTMLRNCQSGRWWP